MKNTIFALAAMLLIAGCGDQSNAHRTAGPAAPLTGEVVYWKDGDSVMARVIVYDPNGDLILEAKQTETALKGILIAKIEVPGCGQVKFQRYELGSLRGTATPSSPESYPSCQVPSWAGDWRIGQLL